jgi:hypothetical protein
MPHKNITMSVNPPPKKNPTIIRANVNCCRRLEHCITDDYKGIVNEELYPLLKYRLGTPVGGPIKIQFHIHQ